VDVCTTQQNLKVTVQPNGIMALYTFRIIIIIYLFFTLGRYVPEGV